MLYIESDGTVRLTRGDTARLTVLLKKKDTNEEYLMKTTDKLTLSIKKNVKEKTPLVQKTVIGANAIHIEPLDTNDLEFGKYKYDVELVTAEGDVYTVVEPTTFEVLEGVT